VYHSVIKQDWTLIVPPLMLAAWALPMYFDWSVGRKLAVLMATFAGAAIVGAALG